VFSRAGRRGGRAHKKPQNQSETWGHVTLLGGSERPLLLPRASLQCLPRNDCRDEVSLGRREVVPATEVCGGRGAQLEERVAVCGTGRHRHSPRSTSDEVGLSPFRHDCTTGEEAPDGLEGIATQSESMRLGKRF
jgi:hypothetical protein